MTIYALLQLAAVLGALAAILGLLVLSALAAAADTN